MASSASAASIGVLIQGVDDVKINGRLATAQRFDVGVSIINSKNIRVGNYYSGQGGPMPHFTNNLPGNAIPPLTACSASAATSASGGVP